MDRISLASRGWGKKEAEVFEECKTALSEQVTLKHRDETKRLGFFTDASDTIWSGIVTQVPPENMSKPHVDMRHEPLGFLSGRFNSTQLGWLVLEKETFAILASLEQIH